MPRVQTLRGQILTCTAGKAAETRFCLIPQGKGNGPTLVLKTSFFSPLLEASGSTWLPTMGHYASIKSTVSFPDSTATSFYTEQVGFIAHFILKCLIHMTHQFCFQSLRYNLLDDLGLWNMSVTWYSADPQFRDTCQDARGIRLVLEVDNRAPEYYELSIRLP